MRSPLARAALWTVAAAVLVHGMLRLLGGHGVCPWLVGVMRGAATDADQAGRLADALWMGFALGALPLLAGIGGRVLPGALLEPLLGGLAAAAASVVAVRALDPLVDALAGGAWLHAALLLVVAGVALASGGCTARLRVLFGVEWLKIRRGRLLRTGLVVAGAATCLAAFGHVRVEHESGWSQAAHVLGVGFWTAEILVLVLGATMVAGEISQGTMKMILPHAYRRAEWIAAKASVLVIAALLFALVICVLGIGWTALDAGLGDVTRVAPAGFGEEDAVEIVQDAATMRGHLIDATLAATASLMASALVGLLLSCVFQGLVPALSASFLVFAALKTGDVFLGFSQETLDVIYAHPPDAMRRLTENLGRALNESWDAQLLGRGLRLSLLTAVLGLLASLRLFGRRDLHG